MCFTKTLLFLNFVAIAIANSSRGHDCGKFREDTGKAAKHSIENAKRWPWYAFIEVTLKKSNPDGGDCFEKTETLFCAATIVDKFNIISAAHCLPVKRLAGATQVDLKRLCRVEIYLGNQVKVKVGERINLNTPNKASRNRNFGGVSLQYFKQSGKPIKLSLGLQMTVHRDYNTKTSKNNLVLFHLDDPLEFGQKNLEGVLPVCLPEKLGSLVKSNINTKDCRIIGFGSINYNKDNLTRLQQRTVSVLSDEKCRKFDKDYNRKLEICAFEKGNRVNDCQNSPLDSGGSLHCRWINSNKWTLVGVATRQHRDDNCGAYFTRLDSYVDWIRKNRVLKKRNKLPIGKPKGTMPVRRKHRRTTTAKPNGLTWVFKWKSIEDVLRKDGPNGTERKKKRAHPTRKKQQQRKQK